MGKALAWRRAQDAYVPRASQVMILPCQGRYTERPLQQISIVIPVPSPHWHHLHGNLKGPALLSLTHTGFVWPGTPSSK